jgi:3-hydroxyisobutyrate dehydrogenase
MRIGVVGLGQMGLGMAGRAVAAGAAVVATDLDAARTALAGPLGVAIADRAAGVAAPLVILSLPAAPAVAAVLAALLPAMAPGAVVADTSTLDPLAARDFAQSCAAHGVAYLDAPVSGGPAGATAGTLTMMVGGEGAALEAARPGLALLSARILHVGASGAGQVAKLVNNLLVATHLAVAGEALRLGERAGVGAEALLAVINAASGRSAATEVNFPRWILSGTFDSGFTAGLMRKDVRLALGLAEAVGATLEATAAAAALWERPGVADAEDFNRVAAALRAGASA